MLNSQGILKQIENKRQEMYECINSYGINNEKTLEKSYELDKLIILQTQDIKKEGAVINE